MDADLRFLEVAVTGGKVRGAHKRGVNVFRGVPYAAPIAGLDRWRPPQPVVPWDGVRDATRFGEVCPQPDVPRAPTRAGRLYIGAIVAMSAPAGEDCLNLNIWTPTLDPDAKTPVLVWIHGGSLTMGAGSQPFYDGAALAAAGIVVVTINYRLGPLGFTGGEGLFEGDVGVANRGFLDQVRALEWVRDNIRAFGGDPDLVTVAGESAGATSVVAMISTPATNGLIRRAIPMSGAISAFPESEYALLARDWFAALGVAPGDVDGLAALSTNALSTRSRQLGRLLARNPSRYGALGRERLSVHGMAIDGRLFPLAPVDFLLGGGKPGLDLMIGTCRDEARLFTIFAPGPRWLASRIMFAALSGAMNPQRRPAVTLANYLAAMPGAAKTAVRERAMADAVFRKGSVEYAGAHAKVSPGRTFLYRFDWPSPALGGALGAIHGLDIPGAFQTYDRLAPLVGDPAAARPAGDALHNAIVAFVKTGSPPWPAYDLASKSCMVFDDPCTVRGDIDAAFEPIW